jgi:phage terminase large subunit-like protein
VERFAPVDVTYDPWMGDPVVQMVQARTRLDMWPLPQRYEHVTDALTKLRAWCKESAGRDASEAPLLRHGGNPVARWAADALEVTKKRDNPDLARPSKPDRESDGRRIDPMSAAVLAIDGAQRRQTHQKPEPNVRVIS